MTSLELSPPTAPPISLASRRAWVADCVAWLFAAVPVLPLVYLRVAFGGIMLWEVWRYFTYGWIKRYYIDPDFFFTYYGFGWVRPLPGEWMYTYFHIVGLLAVCIALGLAYRLVMPLFFAMFTYWFLLDQTNYLNHFYLISLISLLLCFAPANRTFAVDSWLRPGLRAVTVPRWPLAIILLQIGIAYFYGGIAKLNGDWLQGEPMRMWLAERTDFPLIGRWFTEEWMVAVFAFGGLLIDLFAIPALLWRRTRWLALVALVSFHLINDRLFSIGIFPWFMLATLPLFFPLTWWGRLQTWLRRPPTAPQAPAPARSARRRLILAALALFFAWQMLMPLRHFLYPGDVNWTEEGHNFAWHMKLRSKDAVAVFTLYDPDTAQSWRVDPWDYLTKRQASQMPQRPDMVLLFAHHLADRWRADGYPNIHVYAEVLVSLNGRRYQHMIDPMADLARVQRNPFVASDWIMPLSQPLFAAGR